MTQVIAGILRLDGTPPDPAQIETMLTAMAPEGTPSARAVGTSGPCAFGQLILAPNADVPVTPARTLSDKDRLLAADIRLFDTDADPMDRLLDALTREGRKAGATLHGDFAFAHWDGAGLTLARDHFGVRPLQFTHRPGKYLAFASLPAALLKTGLASRALDAEVMKTYPITLCAMGERTYFRDIRSVCAGHTVTLSPGHANPKTERYWRLPLGPLHPATTDPEELASELRRLLIQAVLRRLPTNGAGAGHLSGGLDSTAIGTLAARALGPDNRPFHAFCFREENDDPDLEILDEWTYASAVAQREPNVRLRGISTPGPVPLLDALDPELFFSTHPDEPEEQVLHHAANAGAPVILSGWGGDEVVTWRGHSNIAELFWSGQWQAMSDWITTRSDKGGSSRFGIFRKAVLSESLPRPLRKLVRSRHGPAAETWIETLQSMVPPEHRAALLDVPRREAHPDSRVERRGWLEHWSIPETLQTFAQRGARHGISYAFPMLDLDLVAFAIRIPAILLRDEHHDRAIFRRAMENILPDMVRMKNTKLTPFPAETLRHAEARDDLIGEVRRMSANPQVTRFVDTDGLIAYIESIRDPGAIRDWLNASARRGEPVSPYELYHVMALRLAWFLDRHGAPSG